MTTRTATSVLDAPAGDVFDYLAQIETGPMGDRIRARVAMGPGGRKRGERSGRVSHPLCHGSAERSDRHLRGPDEAEMVLFPSRVVALPDGRSAYTFTMFESPGGSDELFEAQYASLLRELENIRRRFQQSG